MSRTQPTTVDDFNEPSPQGWASRREDIATTKTTYTPIDDDTEMVEYFFDQRPVRYRQRWIGGLAVAPKVGDAYLVVREEWLRDSNGVYTRTIHEWEVQ